MPWAATIIPASPNLKIEFPATRPGAILAAEPHVGLFASRGRAGRDGATPEILFGPTVILPKGPLQYGGTAGEGRGRGLQPRAGPGGRGKLQAD